jgi:integrase
MAKQLVIKMRAACLADKTVVNYFQVVRAVIASAVSSEGEQLYPRNWNFHFIGLPIVDESQQKKPTLTVAEVGQIITRAKGRYQVLFALLAGSGMRVGEGLGLRVEHLTDDFSTVNITQSVWRGKTQSPKTANAVRKIDLHSSLRRCLRLSSTDESRVFSSLPLRAGRSHNETSSVTDSGKFVKTSVWIRMAWAFMPSVVSAQHT